MRTLLLAAVAAGMLVAFVPRCMAQDESQPKQAASRLDRYGDPLPMGAVLRAGTTRLQSKGSFAWTPDGKTLITLRGGTLYFWDTEEGRLQKTLVAPVSSDTFSTYASQFALSRDGKWLVCTDFYGAIGVWNLETNALRARLPVSARGHEENLILAIAPDGKRFFTLRHTGEVQVWDTATCEVVRTHALPETGFTNRPSSALSPDGKTLAIGSQRSSSIYLLDIEKGGAPAIIKPAHDRSLNGMQFLRDGTLVSTGTMVSDARAGEAPRSRAQIRFWDKMKLVPEMEWLLPDSLSARCSVALSPDGRTMISVHSDQIAVWDVKTRQIARTIEGLSFVNERDAHVAIDPTGKYVAVADRKLYVQVWELASGKPHLTTGQHHTSWVRSAAWSPDGKTIATVGGTGGEVCLWDAGNGKLRRRFYTPGLFNLGLQYSGDGSQLLLHGDHLTLVDGAAATGLIRWHEATTGRQLRELREIDGGARLASISPDGSMLAVGLEPIARRAPFVRAIAILDLATGKEQRRIPTGGLSHVALAWLPDREVLHAVVDREPTLLQINAKTGERVAEVELPHPKFDPNENALVPGPIYQAVFLKGAEAVVTCGLTPEIHRWSVPDGEKQWTIRVDASMVRTLALSSDESILACVTSDGDPGTKWLRLFDMGTQRQVIHFELGDEYCECLAFSPDGRRIVVGCHDGTALVYDVADAAAKAEASE